jgi:hypothetical protein
LELIAAAAVPALISLSLGAWASHALGRYFAKFTAARGPVGRNAPRFTFGLGVDDIMVGAWDLIPAWRIVAKPTGDPELERHRRRARLASLIFIAQLPAGFAEAVALSAFLRCDVGFPAVVAFASWGVASLPAQSRAVWLSRREVREFQLLWFRAYGLLAVVVVGTLLIAGVLMAALLLVRG